ncbi:outer membrane protein assembly factor BamB [Chryseobacterium ginsenosidimutans]|uniref:PQQ-like beta-propeller repeat protein n=1 Tax=Chryseobacterium ginsenosidimutans TaxID=687846 RepID=UPI0021696E40|nr:PQQ-like beta-propeller repeat protein [Chryseobacterium ginsenosidimutans]MCS3868835.1 outer membrane protein assembly factor BamB [Chryseobacterium ginsenosidimutans]
MTKVWFLLFFSLLLSCKEAKTIDYDKRHALIANINAKNNLLVYSYWEDNNYAIKVEDLKTNKTIFSTKITDNCFTEPRIYQDKLYFPESNHTFTCIDYKTQKIIWKSSTKGRIREFQIVKNDVIIASINVYGLVAINSNTGKVMYELLLRSDKDCLVDDAPRPVGFDENYFYVANFNCSSLSAYEISSGKNVWSRKENPTPLSNFTVAGKYILIGSKENDEKSEIILLEAKTGKLLFQQNASFNIFADPVFYQNKIYYQTNESLLNEFDIEKKRNKTIFNFNTTDHIGCNQIFPLDHSLYIQDCNYNINKIDLTTNKRKIVDKGSKGLLGVYKINNQVKFIY